MVKMPPEARSLLVLINVTDGWLLPEKGGYWRGGTGTRLSVADHQLRGPLLIKMLLDRGCIEKVKTKMAAGKDISIQWLSVDRPSYKITELGKKEAESVGSVQE